MPSIKQSLIVGMVYTARWCFSTHPELANESEDPESTRDISGISGIVSEVTGIMRVSGVVMEALRVTIVCAQTDEMQPPSDAAGYNLSRLKPESSWALIQAEPRLAEPILLASTST